MRNAPTYRRRHNYGVTMKPLLVLMLFTSLTAFAGAKEELAAIREQTKALAAEAKQERTVLTERRAAKQLDKARARLQDARDRLEMIKAQTKLYR